MIDYTGFYSGRDMSPEQDISSQGPAEIKIPSVDDPELTNVFPISSLEYVRIYSCMLLPVPEIFFLVLISTFPGHLHFFLPNPLPTF